MNCLRWKINNEESITFWLDNWLGLEEPLYQFAKVPIDDEQINAPIKDFNLHMD